MGYGCNRFNFNPDVVRDVQNTFCSNGNLSCCYLKREEIIQELKRYFGISEQECENLLTLALEESLNDNYWPTRGPSHYTLIKRFKERKSINEQVNEMLSPSVPDAKPENIVYTNKG